MARPPHLALAVAALAAVVVPLRNLFAFDVLGEVDLGLLTILSRVLWSLVGVGGFAAIGYGYGSRTTDGPRRTLGATVLAASVGLLVGYLLVRVASGGSVAVSPWVDAVQIGAFVVLDAAMFGFVVSGGYALASDGRA